MDEETSKTVRAVNKILARESKSAQRELKRYGIQFSITEADDFIQMNDIECPYCNKHNGVLQMAAAEDSVIKRYVCGSCEKSIEYPAFINEVSRKKTPKLIPTSATELSEMDLAPVEWIVQDFLPVGLSILSAPSKYYKSYMCLQLGYAVASGMPFLNYKTNQSTVVYFDLESKKRRPKERMQQMFRDKTPPKDLHFITCEDGVKRLHDGFVEQVMQLKKDLPELKLIIIDVLQKIRSPQQKGQSLYEYDYSDMGKLKILAESLEVCILVVHHNRKMQDKDDVFNNMTGSSGLMGSMDTIFTINKKKRNDEEAILFSTGHDVRGVELAVRFNEKLMQWESLGSREEVENRKQLKAYEDSNVIKTIKKLVDMNNGEITLSCSDLKKNSKLLNIPIYDDVRKIGVMIGDYKALLSFQDGIEYTAKRTSKDTKYTFRKNNNRE